MHTQTIPAEACEVVSCGAKLDGSLRLPPKARGLVVFVHGSGSTHLSARNVFVAETLYEAGFGSLLFDLLTAHEDVPGTDARFDIDHLTRRVEGALHWLGLRTDVAGLPVGLFGASTGASAALRAAGNDKAQHIRCVVSRGGRPDLAGVESLHHVTCPTLLIVGEADDLVLALNQRALSHLTCEKKLITVPGATHLFEEPGTLAKVARHAIDWFERHLAVEG